MVAVHAYAYDEKTGIDEYRVECPAFWYGPNGLTKPLTYALEWLGPFEAISAPDFDISRAPFGGLLIDCAYGDKDNLSPFRITVQVPGKARVCFSKGHGAKPGQTKGFVCLTKVDDGGFLGPVKMFVAEPVSRRTRLSGFGLRTSKADVFAVAERDGWSILGQSDEDLSLTREGRDIRILMGADGLTREIIEIISDDPTLRSALCDGVVTRFGLRRRWPQGDDVWPSFSDPGVTIEIHKNAKGMASGVHLIDGAAKAK
ncbi:hypothetical protein [Magnetospirillum molischianum]|nr:hypothetical protein [Magnetospirillum molischianum]